MSKKDKQDQLTPEQLKIEADLKQKQEGIDAANAHLAILQGGNLRAAYMAKQHPLHQHYMETLIALQKTINAELSGQVKVAESEATFAVAVNKKMIADLINNP